MREEEKIAAGCLFLPSDAELKAMKVRAHDLSRAYNTLSETETEKRAAIIAELLGSFGEGSFLQGPITFHYGRHTHIGRRFYGNFNFTVQDDADYMQDKLDRMLRQIYGDAEFVPFAERYPAIKQKKIR